MLVVQSMPRTAEKIYVSFVQIPHEPFFHLRFHREKLPICVRLSLLFFAFTASTVRYTLPLVSIYQYSSFGVHPPARMSSTASAAVGGSKTYENQLRQWISDEKLERIGSRTTIVDALPSFPGRSKPHKLEEVRVEKDGEKNVIWIEWSAENDSENPFNWSRSKKWTTTLICECLDNSRPIASRNLTSMHVSH